MLDKLTSVSLWVERSSERQHEVQDDSRAAPDRDYVPVCSRCEVTIEIALPFDWVFNLTPALWEMCTIMVSGQISQSHQSFHFSPMMCRFFISAPGVFHVGVNEKVFVQMGAPHLHKTVTLYLEHEIDNILLSRKETVVFTAENDVHIVELMVRRLTQNCKKQ